MRLAIVAAEVEDDRIRRDNKKRSTEAIAMMTDLRVYEMRLYEERHM